MIALRRPPLRWLGLLAWPVLLFAALTSRGAPPPQCRAHGISFEGGTNVVAIRQVTAQDSRGRLVVHLEIFGDRPGARWIALRPAATGGVVPSPRSGIRPGWDVGQPITGGVRTWPTGAGAWFPHENRAEVSVAATRRKVTIGYTRVPDGFDVLMLTWLGRRAKDRPIWIDAGRPCTAKGFVEPRRRWGGKAPSTARLEMTLVERELWGALGGVSW